MVTDSIANLINTLKTSSVAGKEIITVPSSNLIASILELLKKEGFVADFNIKGDKNIKKAEITLAYKNGVPAITGVKRVSKTAKRVYKGSAYIESVKRGYGLSVVTTPAGIMSGAVARKKHIGGEVLFEIW